MPVYEYKCKRCNNVFEKLMSRDQRDNPGPCPECHCARSQRMMSVFAGHTTGGGSIGGNSCSGCTSGTCSTCHR